MDGHSHVVTNIICKLDRTIVISFHPPEVAFSTFEQGLRRRDDCAWRRSDGVPARWRGWGFGTGAGKELAKQTRSAKHFGFLNIEGQRVTSKMFQNFRR